MLFSIERDEGDAITGYVVPDSFRGVPSVVIRPEGGPELRLPCTEVRTSLVVASRHETGTCGFTLDRSLLPDLPDRAEISIHESTSGLLVARRCPPERVAGRRVVRFETHLLPLAALDRALLERFRYGYAGIDQYGLETATQVLMLKDGGSLYASGRFAYKVVQAHLEPHAAGVIVLRDPWRELAERLLVLNRVGVSDLPLLGERDRMVLAPAIAYAAGLDFSRGSALRAGLKAMPGAVRSLLADPFTRALTAGDPHDRPRATHLAPALRALSRFSVVGLRERWDVFREDLAAFLGMPAELMPEVEDLPAVDVLAAELAAVSALEGILEIDLALHERVRDAIDGSAAPADQGAGAAVRGAAA